MFLSRACNNAKLVHRQFCKLPRPSSAQVHPSQTWKHLLAAPFCAPPPSRWELLLHLSLFNEFFSLAKHARPSKRHPAIEVAPIRLVMGLIEWTLTTLGFREDVNESRREASTLFSHPLLLSQGDQGNQELLVGLEGPTWFTTGKIRHLLGSSNDFVGENTVEEMNGVPIGLWKSWSTSWMNGKTVLDRKGGRGSSSVGIINY